MAGISAGVIEARFPLLSGHSLEGRKVILPKDLKGVVALIAVAVQRGAQPMVDSWRTPFEEEFAGDPGIAFYEVPVIEKETELFLGGVINAGMKAGIDSAKYGSVITVFADTKWVRKVLGMDDPSRAYLYLLDREGTVRWRGSGFAGKGGIEEVIAVARRLAGLEAMKNL
ncbi:hypothetical protein [uncultured Methanofollis sp.]|uniref:hypothetical protein n=1 Tax=uncultured Methanofollis sp. TaxID=262500 RepID=UPI00262DBD68|nr:hypothetical protein [uncultured Methanofollis sp.]